MLGRGDDDQERRMSDLLVSRPANLDRLWNTQTAFESSWSSTIIACITSGSSSEVSLMSSALCMGKVISFVTV